jgi:hypothetical protein
VHVCHSWHRRLLRWLLPCALLLLLLARRLCLRLLLRIVAVAG